MDPDLKDKFINLWRMYFPGESLPITFEISDDTRGIQEARKAENWRCFICDLTKVRNGTDLACNQSSISCSGGRRYCGFANEIRPDFRYFLSYGIEGKVEGERYKKTPEIVDKWREEMDEVPASGRYILFKRWDHLNKTDNPEVAIFFCRPEVLSGLFTLANYDRADPFAVISPMGAGCSTIVYYPYFEQHSHDPRAVIGMMDPSARPCVPVDILTFAVPMKKFVSMIHNMEESFLTTPTWEKVKKKIAMSS